mmetsp:Transcript_13073/g.18207  ORF Transcript_13073/g.18207 Transcript_13073/m.18207 type:complete len:110 (+) Transcript_13073:1062-1391(+)
MYWLPSLLYFNNKEGEGSCCCLLLLPSSAWWPAVFVAVGTWGFSAMMMIMQRSIDRLVHPVFFVVAVQLLFLFVVVCCGGCAQGLLKSIKEEGVKCCAHNVDADYYFNV